MTRLAVLAGVAVAAFLLSAADAPVPQPSDRNDPNAVRCKKLSVIGSLARKERVCKTNAEWRKSREQQGGDAEDLIARSRAGMDCRVGGGC